MRFLHFSHAEKLLVYIRYCLTNNLHFELCLKVLLILVDNYHQSIVTSHKLAKLLDEIRLTLVNKLRREIDMAGYSLAGLKLLSRELGYLKEEQVELPVFK